VLFVVSSCGGSLDGINKEKPLKVKSDKYRVDMSKGRHGIVYEWTPKYNNDIKCMVVVG
jgi:hypothetical protein